VKDTRFPAFSDAVAHLREFLSAQGHEGEPRWVFRHDIVELGFRVFVHLPLPDYSQQVERLYERGIRYGLGISLQVFCFLDGEPLCYIWLPEDEMDASYRMLSGLKLSIPSGAERRRITGVRSRVRWKWLRWLERRTSRHLWADDIPSG